MTDPEAYTLREFASDAIEWLGSKGVLDRPCTACGARDWSLLDPSVWPDFPTPDNPKPLTTTPVFGLGCNNCAHMLMFNAVVAGLVLRAPEPPPSAPTINS